MFEGPRLISNLPVGMLFEGSTGVLEIGFEVGPEVYPGLIGGPAMDLVEEGGLYQAVLVVALLGPRIRKEDEYVPEALLKRERLKKKPRIRLDKVELAGFGPLLLSRRSLDAIAFDIDADTQFVGVGLGVGHEKVAMPAAELTYERGGLREYLGKRLAERGPPILQNR